MPKPTKIRPPKQHERAWHEGTVKEVRPGVWRAWRERIHAADGKTTRPSRTFKGEGAEERAKTWAKGDVEPDVLLLGHWLDRWLALSKPTVSANTYRLYRHAVMACSPLAARPLADLTMDDWQALVNQLLDRWARSTVAAWRGRASTAMRAAIPRYLAANPLERVRLPRADEQPPKAWRQDEIDRLLGAAVGTHHEPWLVFSLGTGVRLGEARALLWEDVDLGAKTATIRASLDNRSNTRGPTKTRKVRKVDLPDEGVSILAEHAKRQRPGEAHVFGHDGRAYSASTYRSWLRIKCKAAKVRPLPPHSLRHTCASIAFDAGVPVQDVARQLGHTVAVCQAAYAHFIGDDLRRAAKALGRAIRHRRSGPKRVNGSRNGTRETG